MTQIGIFFWFGLVFSPFSRGNVESYYIFRKNAFQTQGMVVFHLYFYGMYKKKSLTRQEYIPRVTMLL